MTELGPLEIDVPWSQVTSFTVEGATQLQRRATVVRYLAVGLLALAWKKAENSAFLVISTAEGDYVFGRKETVHELRASLSTLLTTTKTTQTDASSGGTGVADRLRQLKELHDDGVVDDVEFAETKARLLAEL